MPLTMPLPRYFSMPSLVVGARQHLGPELKPELPVLHPAAFGNYPFSWVILTGPAFEFGGGISRLARTLAVMLSKLFPTLALANVLDTRKLARDPQVLRSYTEDPLVHHGRIPVRTGTEAMRAMAEVNARMEELSVPLLIFHGTNDDLAHPAGSKRLYARAASADKTLHLCEGLFHEVLNEPEHPALLADLVRWLDRHTPS
jgi:acylglycerol lipase